MKFHIIVILLLSLSFSGCLENASETSTGESQEGKIDAVEPISLRVMDSTSGSVLQTNSQTVEVEVKNDVSTKFWCLSETQATEPLSSLDTCNGGQGSSNGWFVDRPTSLILSPTEGSHTVYLWLAQTDGLIRDSVLTSSIILDLTPPVVALDPLVDINIANETSYLIAGDCVGDSTVSVFVDTLFNSVSCELDRWSFMSDVSSLLDGTVTISVSQVDGAGNASLVVSQNVEKDTVAPTISWSNPSNSFAVNAANESSITFSGSCSEDGTILVSGQVTDTIDCTSGSFSKVFSLASAPEGSFSIRMDMQDSFSNPAIQVSKSFFKDTIDPVVAITNPISTTYANLGNYVNFTVNGTCSEDGSVLLSGAGSGSYSCTVATGFTAILNLSSQSDGPLSISAVLTDAVGNTSPTSTVNFNKDIIPPTVTQTDYVNSSIANTGSVTFGGSCDDGSSVIITGQDSNTTACSGSVWSYTTAAQVIDGVYTYTFNQIDLAGNSSSVNGIWQLDQTAPVVNSIVVNDGVTIITNNNITVDFNTTDTRADIDAFCLKYNDSATPLLSDSCWVTLASIGDAVSINYNLVDYPFVIGTILGSYDLYIWTKDDVGNVSIQTDTLNKDKVTLTYQPDEAPVINNVTASSNDTPSDPMTTTDTTVLLGSDIYIKWSITDNHPIPNGNVSVYYTSDEVNFTLLQSGLNNGINGSCSISGVETGCVHLPASSPSNSYIKIKVEVQDSGVSQVFTTSNPLNTGDVNILAGNTSLGIGGSASSAVFKIKDMGVETEQSSRSLVVTNTGYVFVNYEGIGLTYVSPEDGLLKTLIEQTGTISGDGGAASAATAQDIRSITLTDDGNVLFWDAERVRKIDLSVSPWIVTTLFGGGSDSSDGADALSADINYANEKYLFQSLPDGRVYIEQGLEIWYYDPVDQKVKKHISLGGIGIGDMVTDTLSTFEIENCTTNKTALAFNKNTGNITKIMRQGRQENVAVTTLCGSRPVSSYHGVMANFNLTSGLSEAPHPPDMPWSGSIFTGLDGSIYYSSHKLDTLYKYDEASNSRVAILGSGSGDVLGNCVDGTVATSCHIRFNSLFVTKLGKIYFIDNGVVRFIDEVGLVQTLVGQSRYFNAGLSPQSERLSYVRFFSVAGDDVYVKDRADAQIMKFSLNGGDMELVAGNGGNITPDSGDTATSAGLPTGGWNYSVSLLVDPVLNRLYHRRSDDYAYIDLTTGNWVVDTAFEVYNNDRLSYMAIDDDGELLVHSMAHAGGVGDRSTINQINTSTKTNSIIYGQDAFLYPSAGLCDAEIGTDCELDGNISADSIVTQYKYDSLTDNWLIAFYGHNYVNTLPSGGGMTNRFEHTVNDIGAFDFRRSGGNQYLYYCATNGKLYKRNVVSDVETELPMPSLTMSCIGQSVHYHSGRDSLLFIMIQNGLYSIAEYKNP